MSATQYPYTSLVPDTSIRLFTVEPELSNGYVCCTLRHFDGKGFGDMISDGKECDGTECNGERCYGTICHGEIPPYSALSYVWGDSKHTRKMYLGDYLIGVHETLWEFLHQMQTTQKAKTWFWTDYLCLNQADQTEMNQQVQRMGEIYSGAEETLSWLGREGSSVAKRAKDSTPVANLENQLTVIAEWVDKWRTAVEEFFAERPNWTDIKRDRSSSLRRNSEQGLIRPCPEVLGLGYGQSYHALKDVLSLPYWTRVWIVQEVARARAVRLAFGSISINFDDLFLVYKSHAYHLLLNMGSEDRDTVIGAKAAIEARAAVTANSLSMRQVLKWSILCHASRPIDRIYGLLGLLKVHGAQITSNLESLTVDYNKDITSVFWPVVFSCQIFTVGDERTGGNTIEAFLRYEREQFVESLPSFADSLGSPQAFSPQGLSFCSESIQNPSLRSMARLTSRMVHMLQKIGRELYMLPIHDASTYQWSPKRDSARQSRPREMYVYPDFMSRFGLEMAALFLEYAEFDDVGEAGEVHAAYIASRLAETENCSGEWTCKPVHNHLEDDQPMFDDGRMRRIKYSLSWRGRIHATGPGRPVGCSHPDLPTSPKHHEKHECSDSSLFLCLPDHGFCLELDLTPSDSTQAKLTVTVNGHMR